MFDSMKRGMTDTRSKFTEHMNMLLGRGPAVDEEFWEGLEEALIAADVGAPAALDIVERLRDLSVRRALPDAYAVMDALTEQIASTFATSEVNVFDENPVLVLFVGINGAGKTTTVGKIAAAANRAGRNVLLGSADTFRAAAIEQLEEWGRRAGVEIVQRERGADPASVCYETIERAEAVGADFVLIDTAGRLHTSDDLMRELGKVVNVVRKRSNIPVRTVLVIDATTGQNGLSQARLFNRELDLDALIVTKLDGTARGGIALAVSHELNLPIAMIGVGEGLTDLQVFDPEEFAAALIGAEPVEDSAVLTNGGPAAAAGDAPDAGPGDGSAPAAPLHDGSAVLSNSGPSDAAGGAPDAGPGDGSAPAAPLLEESESSFADSDSSSCASLLHASNEPASQANIEGVQTGADPSPGPTSNAGTGLAELAGVGETLASSSTTYGASTTYDSGQADASPSPSAPSSAGIHLAEPGAEDGCDRGTGASVTFEGSPDLSDDVLLECDSEPVPAVTSAETDVVDDGSSGFSWKDDFGNPDEMVDALGAQRELQVVEGDLGDQTPQETVDATPTDAESADAGAAGEEAAQEAPKEGVFKRMWKWLSE